MPDLPRLDPSEIARYSRHLLLPEVGVQGQRRLKAASAVCIGAGGLGSPVGLYLTAAGIGRLGLVDFDQVDTSNLQRQVIHGTHDVGRSKLDSARDRLLDINPHVQIETFPERLTADNAIDILGAFDLVIDGTDNFPTRYLVNDACVLLGKPYVYGSIYRFEGQASLFWARHGPCYRCLFPEPPPPGLVPSCAEGGVLGILPGIIGTIQATEAIKVILGAGELLVGRLILLDALAMRFRELRLRKDPACPVCGTHPTIHELVEADRYCGSEPPVVLDPAWEITPRQLADRLAAGERPLILDVRSPVEWEICHLEGARLIPLPELSQHVAELDRGADVVTVCRLGERSARAVLELRAAGFEHACNLVGGLRRWSEEVDPTLPRY